MKDTTLPAQSTVTQLATPHHPTYVPPALRPLGDWNAVTLVGSSPFELPDVFRPHRSRTIT